MAAVHIRLFLSEPTGSGIDDAAVIQRFQLFVNTFAVKLTPTFIKDGPVENAGVVFQLMYGSFHAPQKFPAGVFVAVHRLIRQFLNANRGQRRIPQEGIIAVIDHVLEHHHAQLVALVVEFLRLYFDMLAQGVESQVFHSQNIFGVAFRCGRGVDAVRPVALIQQAVEEIGFSIQAKSGVIPHLLDFQRTDGKVRFHPILPCFHNKIIKVRIFRTPEVGIFGSNGHRSVFQNKFAQLRNNHLACQSRHGRNGHRVSLIDDIQLFDVLFRNAFQPHCLPDAGHRGVPHAAPLFRKHLLAVGEGLVAQIIDGADDHHIFFLQSIRDVKGHSLIATGMVAHVNAVDPTLEQLIRRTNVQQHPSPLEAFGQGKTAAIPQIAALFIMFLHAGQQTFGAERHQDLLVVCFRLGILHRKFPFAVEVDIRIPLSIISSFQMLVNRKLLFPV